MKKIILIFVSFLIFTGCNKDNDKKEANKVNLNEGVIENKTVNNLLFKDVSVIYDSGLTTFTVKITNNGEDIDLINFKIVFKNQSGTEITTLDGNFNNKIEKNQSVNVEVISDIDLTDAYSVDYQIN